MIGIFIASIKGSGKSQNEIVQKFIKRNIQVGTDIAQYQLTSPPKGDDDTKYQISLRNEVKAMKTKTLSILFALVMVLSLSAGVFAQDFTETWDEETVLTVFSDLDVLFPDLFADEDSNYLFADTDSVAVIPSEFEKDGDDYAAKGLELEDYEAKAPIDEAETSDVEFTFSPCGDGLIKFDVTLHKAVKDSYTEYYGPDKTTYIRDITATVDGNDAEIKKCSSTGGDNCRSVKFNGKGIAHLTGYLYVPDVLAADAAPKVELNVTYSNYMTALWPVTENGPVTYSGTATPNTKQNYCQDSLEEFALGGLQTVRARYDENTGEARFQATIRNYQSTDKVNYAIPAEVLIDGKRYTDYVCKYTVYNTVNAAPRTDYCKFGEGIAMAPNSVIRFDVTIDHIASETLVAAAGSDLPFSFRVGGMKNLIFGVFSAVDYPCPVVSRITVMDPLKPFMTFYGMESDDAIEASGAYGVYEGGLWGLYQKCGKYAYMAVRLKNDGIQDETIYLDHVAVAVNGGTPMSWKWVMSSVAESDDGEIELAPGEDVILIGKAMVTNVPSQMNSDIAITGAVNFLDYGFYITGKVYSDHNNTNCVAP